MSGGYQRIDAGTMAGVAEDVNKMEKIESKHPSLWLNSEQILQKINEKRLSSASGKPEEDKRSASAIVAERILRAVNDGHLSSVESSEQFLHKRAAVEDDPMPAFVPALLARENGKVRDFHGMDLVTYGSMPESRYTVLYIHGGAYTEEILPFHLNFCAKLAKRINACVLVPIYPLAPNHTWRETYELLTALYADILAEKHGAVTFMGDSAGGGLAIAFCQYLKSLGLPQPDHLIGLSPWVDICMTDNDYAPYRPLDPMLDVAGLQTIGKAWAGDLDVRDPKLSPTFGDNHGLPKTLIFTGTREILYPDIRDFYEKLRRDDVEAELVVAEGMNHVYPLYGLPESKAAVERIDREITGGAQEPEEKDGNGSLAERLQLEWKQKTAHRG